MKRLLIILFFFMIQICKSTEFETFEKKRKLIADHIQDEISRGESPLTFSSNIFGNPNWLNRLYKCNQIASYNKNYDFDFDDCIDFFTQVSAHHSLENKSKAEILNATQEYKNFFVKKYTEALEKKTETLKKEKLFFQKQNLYHLQDVLRTLNTSGDEDGTLIRFLDKECTEILGKKEMKNFLVRKQCSQLIDKIKDGDLANKPLIATIFTKIFSNRTIQAADKLKNDIEITYYNNAHIQDLKNEAHVLWHDIQPDLKNFLSAEKTKELSKYDERFSNLCIKECNKFIEQKDLISNEKKYDFWQYNRCNNTLLRDLRSYVESSDSYFNYTLGYTEEKIRKIKKLQGIIKTIHTQMTIDTFNPIIKENK